jgi:tetratricopeptide (TPR) repeat protein
MKKKTVVYQKKENKNQGNLDFSNPKFLSLILGVYIFIIYLKVISFEFVNFDDYKEILKNDQIVNFSLVNTYNIFFNPNGDLYIPLVNFSFNIENYLFGFNPKAFHLTNLLFHISNSILVFCIFVSLFKSNKLAFLVALIFGIHPFKVESIAWVIERKDVLYSFFFLLSILTYHLYQKSNKKKIYLISVFLFFLSCLSKPMAVTLPAVLLIYDYFYLNKKSLQILWSKIPYFAISGFMIFLAFKYMKVDISMLEMVKDYNYFDRIVLFFHSLFFYFQKTLLPFNLSAIYNYPEKINGYFDFYYYVSAFLCLTAILLVVIYRKKNRIVMSVFFFYLITISPVIQLFPNTYSITADRYSYIPTIGLIAIIVYLLNTWFKNKNIEQFYRNSIFFSIVFILSLTTIYRLDVWKNSETLYLDIINKNQTTPSILCNYGDLLLENNRKEEALGIYSKANNKFPNRVEILARIGSVYFSLLKYEKAIYFYEKAISIDSSSNEILTNLGGSYLNKGNYLKAIHYLLKAYDIDSKNAFCCYNLGFSYWKIGDKLNSRKYMEKAVKLKLSEAMIFINENFENK